MATTGIRRTAWITLAIVAGVGGYVAGSQRSHQTMIGLLQTEAAGNLTQRIEVLSLLRMDDAPAAILRLESETDLLAQSIARNPAADQRALAYMKTYLSVAPPSPARAQALNTSLEGIPTLAPSQCETALKALLLSAKGSDTGR